LDRFRREIKPSRHRMTLMSHSLNPGASIIDYLKLLWPDVIISFSSC